MEAGTDETELKPPSDAKSDPDIRSPSDNRRDNRISGTVRRVVDA
jgi:hypothetical protein